ncbi:hypothetical protein ANSO36C_50040 [Nostoc cf. commune SO-36]|uniref:Uncharacterized protein n=1 Tax=Nostoc cf. commune SO-36 TaxID=449208 RepID=A0ABM7Z7Q9_NOSCO|nr:hypothetical protein ANSO36C_50040 [Nostoc cf. commune SO-36]
MHFIKRTGEYNLDNILLRLLGGMILLVTVLALVQLLLLTFFPKFNLPELPKLDLQTNFGRLLTITLGAVLGCFVGLTSVSSGSIFALMLIGFFRLAARKLVGTDISHAGNFTTVYSPWSSQPGNS